MEVKKSRKADLERLRPIVFVIALVLTAGLFVCVLQIRIGTDGPDPDVALFEDIAQDMELPEPASRNELLAPAHEQPDEQLPATDYNIVTDEAALSAIDDIDFTAPPPDADDEPPTVAQQQAEAGAPLSFRVVESLPEFPGGMGAFVKWLTDNLRYPPSARKSKTEGRVVVTFVVNRDGTVSDLSAADGADARLVREALRVFGMMPRWKPGKDRGEACRTMMVVPVVFAI